MKICKTELLLLGGAYQVLFMIISSFNSDIAFALASILYILFWVSVLALSLAFVNSWGYVYKLNNNFPRLSVFLASIGWIPYFQAIYSLISSMTDYYYVTPNSLTIVLNNFMPIYDIYMALIVLSLVYATYKVFYKKEDLTLSCYNLQTKL
ncbi:MAG: hypothetical protein IKW39_05965 [Alphaproteobacteria bacterium]|nr:hypothetical protein [Alphaproteobacteria bacterium]